MRRWPSPVTARGYCLPDVTFARDRWCPAAVATARGAHPVPNRDGTKGCVEAERPRTLAVPWKIAGCVTGLANDG